MKRKAETNAQNEADVSETAGEVAGTGQQVRRSSTVNRPRRASVTMEQPVSAASHSAIAAANGSNSFGLLRRSRRQTAPTTTHHHHATTDGVGNDPVDGKPSTISGHQPQQHGGAVQVMQQADFSHIGALTTMALPSLMASYHASLCQQQLRLTPRTSTTDAASETTTQHRASRLSVVDAPSTAMSDLSSGGARARAASVSVAPEELLADEYERLNKAMTPDMEAKALGGDADDQDYSMYVQSCKLDVAIETASTTKKQMRTVRDYVTLIGCIVMMMMLEPVGLSSGVFVNPLRTAFGVSSTDVGFALSLQLGGLLAVSPLDNWLNVRFGMQTVLMFGASVSVLSFLLTAFLATQIWHFYIGYGFFGGLALGMAEYSLVAGSAFIFPGRGDLLALICVGVSAGNIAIPPILSKIIEACDEKITVYVNETITNPGAGHGTTTALVAHSVSSGSGWRGGLFVVAGAQALVILLALTFRVPEERFFHPPPALVAASGKNFFPHCIYNKQFVVLATFYFFWIMHMQFFSYGPSIVSAAVQDDSITSGYILSVYSAAQLCGRLGTVYLNTKPLSISLRAYTTAGVIALMGVCLIILAAMVNPVAALLHATGAARFVILCIPTAVAGCCSGIIWASCSWIMLEVFGPFQFGSAQNFVNPSGGASNYAGIFAAGKMATDTGIPESPLYMGGAGLLIAGGIMCVLGLIQRRRQIADYAPPAKHVALESAASTDDVLIYGSRRSLAASKTQQHTPLAVEVDDEAVEISNETPPLSTRLTNQSGGSAAPREEFLLNRSLVAGNSAVVDRLDSVLTGDHHRRPWSAWTCGVGEPRDEFLRSTEENSTRTSIKQFFGRKNGLNLAYAALDPEPAIRLLVENNRHAWDMNSTTPTSSSSASNDEGLKLSWLRSNTGGAYGLYDRNSSDASVGGYGSSGGRHYYAVSSSTELLPKGSSLENWHIRGDETFG